MSPVMFIDEKDLTDALIAEIAILREAVWQRTGTVEKLAALRQQAAIYNGPHEQRPQCLYIRDQARVVAFARVFARTILLGSERKTILALASVCSAPDLRGQGLGKAIVQSAFALVEHGSYSDSLFQTSRKVQPFYEKLGAITLGNCIVNSLSEQPEVNPFWDEVAMRYPARNSWSDAKIDLLGPGY